MYNYCIGVDLGGTTVKMGLFELNGHLVDKWSIATNKKDNGKYVVSDLYKSIMQKCKELQIEISELSGIGIGVPGPVVRDGFVSLCANVGWRDYPLANEWSKLSDIPFKVANDANVAVMGEMWQGSGKGYHNLVMITLGTGIGGGVIIDQKIVPGLFGAAGEIGHITIVPDEEEICGCGRRGCLEQAASATGIIKQTKKLLTGTNLNSVLREKETFSTLDVFQAAKSGDELAEQVVNRAARYLGLAMATITGVLDPEVYLIGGGVSNAGQYLVDLIKRYYQENVLYTCKDTEIRLATLGNDAGIYGAAGLVIFN